MEQPTKKRVTHDSSGKLQAMAEEFFSRAYGLGNYKREDHNALCEEAMAKTECSRRAFRELIYGHSYHSILGHLRELVPGYPEKTSKKQQREMEAAEQEAIMRQMQAMGGAAMETSSFLNPLTTPTSPRFNPLSPRGLAQNPSYLLAASAPTAGKSEVSPLQSDKSRVDQQSLRKGPDLMMTETSYDSKRKAAAPTTNAAPSPISLTQINITEPHNSFKQTEQAQGPQGRHASDASIGGDVFVRTEQESSDHLHEENREGESVRLKENKEKEEKEAVREKEEKAREVEKEKDALNMASVEKRGSPSSIAAAAAGGGGGGAAAGATGTAAAAVSAQSSSVLGSVSGQEASPTASGSNVPISPSGVPSAGPTLTLTPPSVTATGAKSLVVALLVVVARQYLHFILPLSLTFDTSSALIFTLCAFSLVGVLFHSALQRKRECDKIPVDLTAQIEEYVETWEFLAVADPRQLVAALQQALQLLDASVERLVLLDTQRPTKQSTLSGDDLALDQSPTAANVRDISRIIDFLHGVHINLVTEFGAPELVMCLVVSLRNIKGSFLRLNSLCRGRDYPAPGGAFDTAKFLSAVVYANAAVILGVAKSSLLSEILIIGGITFVQAYTLLFIRDQDVFSGVSGFIARISAGQGSTNAGHVRFDIDVLLALRERIVRKVVDARAKAGV